MLVFGRTFARRAIMPKNRPLPNLHLSEEQVRAFHEAGVLVLEDITTLEEIENLRGIFRRLFSERAGREQGAQFDMVGRDEDDAAEAPPRSPQIINPQFFAPELERTLYAANALAVARALLGPRAKVSFQHAICKPAGVGAPTPWHQDEAFRRDYAPGYREISIWLPLQAVGRENGCMEFVPGSHRNPVLPHRSPGGDTRVHTLECPGGFDPAAAVLCPLPLGSASVHHCRTLHHAGANVSSQERIAYVIGLHVPPATSPRRSPHFPWNAEKQTANLARKRAWRRRGGVLVELRRRLAQWFAARRQPGR